MTTNIPPVSLRFGATTPPPPPTGGAGSNPPRIRIVSSPSPNSVPPAGQNGSEPRRRGVVRIVSSIARPLIRIVKRPSKIRVVGSTPALTTSPPSGDVLRVGLPPQAPPPRARRRPNLISQFFLFLGSALGAAAGYNELVIVPRTGAQIRAQQEVVSQLGNNSPEATVKDEKDKLAQLEERQAQQQRTSLLALLGVPMCGAGSLLSTTKRRPQTRN
jgi:hypothetical protein